MSYYVRLFTKSLDHVPLETLHTSTVGQEFTFELTEGTEARRTTIVARNAAGELFCEIDRDGLLPGEA